MRGQAPWSGTPPTGRSGGGWTSGSWWRGWSSIRPSGVLLWATGSTGTLGFRSLALSPDETDVVLTGGGGASWVTAAFNAATGARRWLVTANEGGAQDVVVDATRVYVTGEGYVGISGFLTVVAYDRATGARLWRRDANPPTCCAIGLQIALAPDGSLVVAGRTQTGGYFNWWTVAMETNGAVRWQALRDATATAGDEFPAAVFVLADGTTVVSGTGGPATRDILGNSYMQGVTAGYSPNGTLLWEGFSKQPTVWATALPNGDVCATGGYDALITCWRVSGVVVSNQPPTAVMSATPSSGVAPLTVRFDGSGSTDPDGAVSSWAWAFGDGASGTGAAITHVYSTPGTYTASLTVTDQSGASSTTTGSISVTIAPAPTLTGLTLAPVGLVGGQRSTGTVTLGGPAPSGGAVVALSSSSSVASVPATVTVPAGATSASFAVATKRVPRTKTVTIKASYNGGSVSATLTVTH